MKKIVLSLLSIGLISACAPKEQVNLEPVQQADQVKAQSEKGFTDYVIRKLTPLKQEAQKEFQKIDKNGDGFVSFDEDKVMAKSPNLPISFEEYWTKETKAHKDFLVAFRQYYKKMFTDMDTSKDNSVSREELLANTLATQSKEASEAIFGALDKSKDGFLSETELRESGNLIAGNVRNYDKSKDKKISKDEYLNYIKTEASKNPAMKHLMVFIYPDAASVNEMVYASDLNKDGLLDFSEFEDVLYSNEV